MICKNYLFKLATFIFPMDLEYFLMHKIWKNQESVHKHNIKIFDLDKLDQKFRERPKLIYSRNLFLESVPLITCSFEINKIMNRGFVKTKQKLFGLPTVIREHIRAICGINRLNLIKLFSTSDSITYSLTTEFHQLCWIMINLLMGKHNKIKFNFADIDKIFLCDNPDVAVSLTDGTILYIELSQIPINVKLKILDHNVCRHTSPAKITSSCSNTLWTKINDAPKKFVYLSFYSIKDFETNTIYYAHEAPPEISDNLKELYDAYWNKTKQKIDKSILDRWDISYWIF